MISPSTGSRSNRSHVFAFALLACIAMVAAIAPIPARGEETSPEACQEGFERAPGQRQCVPIEQDLTLQVTTAEPTATSMPQVGPVNQETPVIQPAPRGLATEITGPEVQPQGNETPEPSPEQPTATQPPTTGGLWVYTTACPFGYSGGATDGHSGPCTPQPGSVISVSAGGNPVGAGLTYLKNQTASVYFSGLPVTLATIDEAPPSAIVSARAWCGILNKAGYEVTEVPVSSVLSIQVNIVPGKTVVCVFVNVMPLEPVDFYFAEMHPWICPLDPVTDVDLLRESCQVSDPVDFTVTDAAGNVRTGRPGGDGSTVRIDGIPPGAFTVTGTIPDGVTDAFVTCQPVDAESNALSEFAEVTAEVTDRSLAWVLDPESQGIAPGNGLRCDVYLFPASGAESGGQAG